jgi:serine protease Do
VSQVEKDGLAAKAGLQEGDIITAVNGKAVDNSVDMPVIIGSMAPGSTARLSVIRNGKQMSINVKVQEAKNESAKPSAAKEAAANKLGVTVRVLTEDEQKQVGTEGLLVTESTGAARKAGIRQGDIIVNVNGVKITEVDDLAKVLEKNKNLRVLVQRRDGRIFIPVRIK